MRRRRGARAAGTRRPPRRPSSAVRLGLAASAVAVGVLAVAGLGGAWYLGVGPLGPDDCEAALREVAAREAGGATSGTPTETSDAATASTAAGAEADREADGETRAVSIALAGDIHAEGAACAVVGGLGPVSETLAAADLALVNLETAIVTSDDARPEDKDFTFAAPPEVLGGLAGSGVDVVSLANNHGMDYGTVGLRDTLAAARAHPTPDVIGIGASPEEAWRPHETRISGHDVGVLAATDVMEGLPWAAVDGPGLASAVGPQEDRLVAETAALAERTDVTVVFLHWGVQLDPCPSDRQRTLAARLVDAGADIVAGTHAHVVQPVERLGSATVVYGLGHLAWYHSRPPGNRTGVLTVTVHADGTHTTSWQPATIVDGLPVPDGDPVDRPPSACRE